MSNKIHQLGDHGIIFKCPGCKEKHVIFVGGNTGPQWSWNGSLTSPTFTPSILVTWGQRAPDPDDDYMCCHSYVTNGRIQFLGDCTHDLAGHTVDLPEW